jgi:hypothetical protein
MNVGRKSKQMDVFEGDFKSVDTDLLVVSAFEGQTAPLSEWSQATGGEIERVAASKEFSGKIYELFLTPIVAGGYRARRLAVVGLGPSDDFTVDRARRAASAVGLHARPGHRLCPHPWAGFRRVTRALRNFCRFSTSRHASPTPQRYVVLPMRYVRGGAYTAAISRERRRFSNTR